jgi:hypothetical protein
MTQNEKIEILKDIHNGITNKLNFFVWHKEITLSSALDKVNTMLKYKVNTMLIGNIGISDTRLIFLNGDSDIVQGDTSDLDTFIFKVTNIIYKIIQRKTNKIDLFYPISLN